MNLKEQRKMLAAHEREAQKEGADFWNQGWTQNDTGICSKTDKGFLDTQVNENGTYTHTWTAYK